MYKPTTALYKIAEMTSAVRIVQGSQGASKTISILMLMINSCQHNVRSMTVFQYERSKMKRTIIRDFISIMKKLEFFDPASWNITDSVYTFPNGSYMEFMGLDVADIGKGFRRDIVYFNEVNRGRITLDTFVQVQSRTTITYADFNPDALFWIHTDVLPQLDAELITLTFEDNEYLPEQERRSILGYREKGFHDINGSIYDQANIRSRYWANKWIVYGLGLPGTSDSTILTDWQLIDTIPEEAELIGSGLDFGYSADPTAVVTVYKYNDALVVDEVLFMKGLAISEIANGLRSKSTGTVYCDSADPRSIKELNLYGIRAVGVKKGQGSVIAGIEILQSKTLHITKKSKNLIKALENYLWEQDSEGNITNKPSHMYSDIIDALRYLAISKLNHTVKVPNYCII